MICTNHEHNRIFKMKVLVISNMYPSKQDPTFGVFVRNFYVFLCNKDSRIDTSLIAIKGQPKTSINKLLKYIVFYIKITFYTLFFDFDLIYVHTVTYPVPPLRFVSIFKKLPLAFNIHGSDWITHSSLAEKLKKTALPLIKSSKMIVVPSTIFADKVTNELPDVKNKIYVSYSGGINSDIFKCMRDNSSSDKILVLGYVSRIIEN